MNDKNYNAVEEVLSSTHTSNDKDPLSNDSSSTGSNEQFGRGKRTMVSSKLLLYYIRSIRSK